MLGRAAGAGALAGAVGVAPMTLGEKLEQAFTAPPDSEVPGRSVLRLAGRNDHQPSRRRVNLPVQVGMAVGVGAVRGVYAFTTGAVADALAGAAGTPRASGTPRSCRAVCARRACAAARLWAVAAQGV